MSSIFERIKYYDEAVIDRDNYNRECYQKENRIFELKKKNKNLEELLEMNKSDLDEKNDIIENLKKDNELLVKKIDEYKQSELSYKKTIGGYKSSVRRNTKTVDELKKQILECNKEINDLKNKLYPVKVQDYIENNKKYRKRKKVKNA